MNLLLNNKRESGIELLKVFAILGIIMCHVYTVFTGVIDENNNILFFDEYTLSNIEYFLIQIIISFGYLSNTIFFVCTSWFLCEQENNKKEKIVYIILCAIIITTISTVLMYCCGSEPTTEDVLRCIFPISKQVYWYMTAYVMLYTFYPYINKSLNSISQREHLSLALGLFFIYFIFSFFINEDLFYINKILSFISTYIIVSYIRKYKKDFCNNLKMNICLFAISAFVFYSIRFINFAITPIKLDWHRMYNPFFLLMAIGALNIFRKFKFKSGILNAISASSMFIYMFHSNKFFLDRVAKIAFLIMSNSNLNLIIIKIIIISTLILLLCFVLSIIFITTLKKHLTNISTYVVNKIGQCIDKLI